MRSRNQKRWARFLPKFDPLRSKWRNDEYLARCPSCNCVVRRDRLAKHIEVVHNGQLPDPRRHVEALKEKLTQLAVRIRQDAERTKLVLVDPINKRAFKSRCLLELAKAYDFVVFIEQVGNDFEFLTIPLAEFNQVLFMKQRWPDSSLNVHLRVDRGIVRSEGIGGVDARPYLNKLPSVILSSGVRCLVRVKRLPPKPADQLRFNLKAHLRGYRLSDLGFARANSQNSMEDPATVPDWTELI